MNTAFEIVSGWSAADRRHVTSATVTCARCHAAASLPLAGDFNPEWARKRIEARGWQFTRRTAICPACQSARKENTAMTTPLPPKPPAAKPPAPNGPAPPPPPVINTPTPQHRLSIRLLLDEHFDDQRGCYLDGYSDERIAKETQVAPSVVAAIREAAYGPLKPQPTDSDVERTLAIGALVDALPAFEKASSTLLAAITRLLKALSHGGRT